ncbi:hypothetical protein Enr17x_60140 [Gimesia fumaroli]|uniref:Uncharacterized protein n=2 Tax=Gimesia fumaroli TaxID=2527976 RepID=A0A518ILH1_9PLAN|nr:hypothetical protein Enr17x_60140 [Gimesia fumaroli]
MAFARLLLIFFTGMMAAATWHLYLSAQNLHLARPHIAWAFGLGFSAGLMITAFSALFKHALGGISAGVFVCYLLALCYITFWAGIPVEWIY